ncbi:MAG: cobalt ECF transporter T component CbiQ [Halodesulfurarchaeum sp.]
MHETLEGVQQTATPAIRGPLQVSLVLFALGMTITAPSRLAQMATAAVFLGLGIDAVGVRPLRWLSVPVVFLAPGVFVIMVTRPGNVLFALGPLSVTHGGLDTAIDTLSRSISSIVVASFLIASTPISTVIATLRRAGLPAVLVELLLYIYRGIAIVLAEAERMRTAATARLGYRSRRTTLRTTTLLASSLFVRTFDSIGTLGEAMRARNYSGSPPAAAAVESRGYGLAAAVALFLVGVRVV